MFKVFSSCSVSFIAHRLTTFAIEPPGNSVSAAVAMKFPGIVTQPRFREHVEPKDGTEFLVGHRKVDDGLETAGEGLVNVGF